MAKAIREIMKSPKKRAAAAGTPVLVRLQADSLTRLDDWRRDQSDIPSRAEAIRRLIDVGLKAKSGKR